MLFVKRCQTDVLLRTVISTWVNGFLDEIITKVFKRLEKILCVINEGEGGNDLVETKYGPRVASLTIIRIGKTLQINEVYVMNLKSFFGGNPNS